jgi:hypothetical protein
MGEFKVIECRIKDNFYTLIYEFKGVKYKDDMFLTDRLTEEEFILKVKEEWEKINT